jgi:2Fe-2S ferredoxin
MARVVIEALEGPGFAQDVPNGGALVDLCDDNETPVPFSCRSASCGTCRIDVLEGHDQLLPPEDEELDILDVFGDDPSVRRLACQAKMRPGLALLRIRPVPPDV